MGGWRLVEKELEGGNDRAVVAACNGVAHVVGFEEEPG